MKILLRLVGIFAATRWKFRSDPLEMLSGKGLWYYAPENITLEQAKQTALQRAKIEALAENFGTIVSQNNATAVNNANEKSNISFLSLSESDVKGEWIETTQEPEYKIAYEKEMLVVTVSVCGKAGEIIGAGIDFSAKVLRNGTEAKYENDNFKNGDDIFLLFQSPADGYLAVYLIDDSQMAYCLLPYMNDPSGKVKIKSGKEYEKKNQLREKTEPVV